MPDPYRASAGASDPGSWNRYLYVGGDPINFKDRRGLKRDESEDDDFYDVPPFKPMDPLEPAPPGPPDHFGPVYGDGTKMKQFSDDMRTSAHNAIANLSAGCNKSLGKIWNIANGTSSLLYKTDSGNKDAVIFFDHCCPKQDRPVAMPAENGRLTAL